MVLLLGINSGALTSWDQLIRKNALDQARQFWEEEIATGNPHRDHLEFPDPVTGQPNRLSAGIRACTAVLMNGGRYRAGTWVLRWTGVGSVQVDWANGIGPSAPDTTGRLTATIATPTDGFNIRILTTDPANPVRLQSLTHIDDEQSPDGFQAWWVVAWRFAGNRIFRPLNWMEATSLEHADQIRPDTWWTESDEALDSTRVTLSGSLVSTIGERRNVFRGGNPAGHGWIVRGIDGGWHIRMGSGQIEVGDELRAVGASSGPVVTSFGAADTGSVGCSIGLLVEVMETLDVDLWATTSFRGDDTYHRTLAQQLFVRAPRHRRVWWEYSNETWNPNFPQYHYCVERGVALNMPRPSAPEIWYSGAQFYALRSEQVAQIAREVFQSEPARLEVVFAGQHAAGEEWYRWRTIINPTDLAAYRTAWPRRFPVVNNWATAPYFRPYKISGSDRVHLNNADLEAMTDAQLEQNLREDMQHWLRPVEGSAPFRGGGLPLYVLLAQERAALQDGIPCRAVCYEGGQEIIAPGDATPQTQARLLAFQNSAHMRTLFDEYLAAVEATSLYAMCLYNSDGVWYPGAMFGLYDNPLDAQGTDNDVKYRAMFAYTGGGDNPVLVPKGPSEHMDRSRISGLQIVQTSFNFVSQRYSHGHDSRQSLLGLRELVTLTSVPSAHQVQSDLSGLVSGPGVLQLASIPTRVSTGGLFSALEILGESVLVSIGSQVFTCGRKSGLQIADPPIRDLVSLTSRHRHEGRLSAGTVRTPQGNLTGPVRLRWIARPNITASHLVMADLVLYAGAATGIAPVSGLARPFQAPDAFAGFARQTVDTRAEDLAMPTKRVEVDELGVVELKVQGLTSHAVLGRLVAVVADDTFQVLPADADPTRPDVMGRVLLWTHGSSGLVYFAARPYWDGLGQISTPVPGVTPPAI